MAARWELADAPLGLEHHWTAISLRTGLHIVCLHSLETLRLTRDRVERIHAPITDAALRRWLWVDTTNAVTLDERGTLYVVDNVGAAWVRPLDGALTPRTPTGIAAHPAPGPRSSRHRSALALDPSSGSLVIAGGQLRTDSYVLALGHESFDPIAPPRLARGDASAFATDRSVRHFASGALSELAGGRWKRVATHRAELTSQKVLHDPRRDRWLLVQQPIGDRGTAELRVLERRRFGDAVVVPGELSSALDGRRGTVLAYDPLTDELVHVDGERAARLSVAALLTRG